MSELAALLTERLTAAAREQSFPYCRPKDAATLILVDRSGRSPKVLLGRRHRGHAFMPGKFVFPGGRVEPADRRMSSATPISERIERQLMRKVGRPSPERARAMALTAIRETFEETGFMVGVKASPTSRAPGAHWAPFAQAGVQPDLAALHLIGRAITPPGRPRRFDTRFFATDARAIVHRIDGVVGPDAELVELVWLTIAEAKRLDTPVITQAMLAELEARLACGFDHAAQVPFYRMRHGRFVRETL
ncbi:MAG TPA: NUDIX hydrolase [Xanthobacteraceae bacterium]|nr:NUDIX hydrolase [Xanthobacteraceae bacterium]